MKMPSNLFKQALQQQQLQVGLFLGLANPLSAEILAGCGYDYLLIDAEHGPNDLRSVQAQLQVLAAYPVQAIVRPPNHDAALIKQLLGAGVQTLLLPMVESAEQAQALVRAMRYPPKGIRGVGTGLERGARWNGVDDYFQQVEAELCLIVQVESAAGLAQLEAILAVDGVDGVFIGPADLAASLGYLGQAGHPAVKAAIAQALASIRVSGKAAGIFATDATLALEYQAAGVCFLAIGADTGVLRSAAIKLLDNVRLGAANGKPGAAY